MSKPSLSADSTDQSTEDLSSLTLPHYSPSQIETFVDCPRKWFWSSILRYREPRDGASNWGVNAHKLIEKYLLTGEMPPVGQDSELQINERVKEYIDQHLRRFEGRPLEVEKRVQFRFPLERGVDRFIYGRLDLVDYAGGSEFGVPYDVEILDHKTMRDYRYASEGEELKWNRQLLLYSEGLLREKPDVKAIKFSHGQVRREGEVKAQLVSTVVKSSFVRDSWRKTLPIIERMDSLRVVPGPADVPTCGVPGQHKNCQKYGGCPYLEMCKQAGGGSLRKDLRMPAINPPDSTRRKEGDLPLFDPNLEDQLMMSLDTKGVTMNERLKAIIEARKSKKTEAPAVEPETTETEQAAPEVEESEPAAQPEKKKRGRKKKESEDAPAPEAKEPVAERQELFLYINCRPNYGAPVTIEELLAPVLAELAEVSGHADWRLHEYGAGKGHILSALRQMPSLPLMLVVDRRSDLAFTLEFLRPKASRVTEGF